MKQGVCSFVGTVHDLNFLVKVANAAGGVNIEHLIPYMDGGDVDVVHGTKLRI